MLASLIPVLAQLAAKGIDTYTQLHQAAVSKDVARLTVLLPIAADIYGATRQVGDVLQKSQAEGWTDGDARWRPAFDAADQALKAAEDRLPPPG